MVAEPVCRPMTVRVPSPLSYDALPLARVCAASARDCAPAASLAMASMGSMSATAFLCTAI
jgi:hypothetical protein